LPKTQIGNNGRKPHTICQKTANKPLEYSQLVELGVYLSHKIAGMKYGLLLGLWMSIAAPSAIAQSTAVDTTQVYSIVDQMPAFPGGPDAFRAFIKANLHLPRVIGQPLRVHIQFIVERDGSLSKPHISKHAFDTRFDDEAMRVVKMMPRWTAGKMRGTAVNVEYMLPILFKPEQ
jgi:hypothetical protein